MKRKTQITQLSNILHCFNKGSPDEDDAGENKIPKDESAVDENKSEETIEVYQEIEDAALSQEEINVASQTDELTSAGNGSIDVEVESNETTEEVSKVNHDEGKYH